MTRPLRPGKSSSRLGLRAYLLVNRNQKLNGIEQCRLFSFFE